ncbi:MAG: ribosome-associated translation inhibitor RaiA [Candidatus Abyssobacteria bacterium SURF_5]|uniref:Ribosome hibernation promoting factor n=1 Tax=Abyssobacteria bacterium (strain SURF_5) TaxID=2093360 RepID=A0A3A4NVE7_ABYX5|nr:MAG: ribosome-associated translation inhibitor RaiA [Candidatus Abyssubacteria bacterium SURF_5]
MQLMITGRHVDITEPLRTHIEKKMQKIKAYFDRIIEVRVVLSVEKYRQFAEITILGSGIHFHSTESTEDMYASIDKALEKIERQLRRRTTKVRQSKRKKGAEPAVAAAELEEEVAEAPEQELIEQYGQYRVTVANSILPKPVSVEEAIMQLDVSDGEFLAFVNQQTDEVNVVFRKKEGGYGLLRRPF